MGISNMGVMNTGWGICGFTSSLYALYSNNPAQQLKLAKGGASPTMVLAEIKTYLKMVEADGNAGLLKEIESFTKSFGGVHASFTIDDYIKRINEVVKTGADPKDAKYSIAMPPQAVADYLQRSCGFNGARIVDLTNSGTELILGVYETKGTKTLYKGLAHYLYYLNGTIHSWGKTFKSVEDAMGAGWDVCYKIAPG